MQEAEVSFQNGNEDYWSDYYEIHIDGKCVGDISKARDSDTWYIGSTVETHMLCDGKQPEEVSSHQLFAVYYWGEEVYPLASLNAAMKIVTKGIYPDEPYKSALREK